MTNGAEWSGYVEVPESGVRHTRTNRFCHDNEEVS